MPLGATWCQYDCLPSEPLALEPTSITKTNPKKGSPRGAACVVQLHRTCRFILLYLGSPSSPQYMQRAFSKCMATLRWIRLLTQDARRSLQWRKTPCAHMNLVAFHTWTQGEYRLWVPHLPRRSVCFLTEKSSGSLCFVCRRLLNPLYCRLLYSVYVSFASRWTTQTCSVCPPARQGMALSVASLWARN